MGLVTGLVVHLRDPVGQVHALGLDLDPQEAEVLGLWDQEVLEGESS